MSITDFHVNGPTKISFAAAGDYAPAPSTQIELGYTNNEDLISMTVKDHHFYFHTNGSGQMYADAVSLGSTAVIRFTMTSWDQVALQKLLYIARQYEISASPSADQDEGRVGVVGRSAEHSIFNLWITPTNLQTKQYEFLGVFLSGGPEYLDLGNAPKRIALEFTTVRPLNPTQALATITTIVPPPP